jgi:hypothetical protein
VGARAPPARHGPLSDTLRSVTCAPHGPPPAAAPTSRPDQPQPRALLLPPPESTTYAANPSHAARRGTKAARCAGRDRASADARHGTRQLSPVRPRRRAPSGGKPAPAPLGRSQTVPMFCLRRAGARRGHQKSGPARGGENERKNCRDRDRRR